MNLEIREVYQIRFWLNKLSPLIWRRFLINPQCTTIADLHHLIQLTMHWEDFHLLVSRYQEHHRNETNC